MILSFIYFPFKASLTLSELRNFILLMDLVNYQWLVRKNYCDTWMARNRMEVDCSSEMPTIENWTSISVDFP